MHVKSRSANVGAIQNFFHRDGVIALFANQGNERLAQEGLRLLNPPIRQPFSRHVTAPQKAERKILNKLSVLFAIAHINHCVLQPDIFQVYARYRTDVRFQTLVREWRDI